MYYWGRNKLAKNSEVLFRIASSSPHLSETIFFGDIAARYKTGLRGGHYIPALKRVSTSFQLMTLKNAST